MALKLRWVGDDELDRVAMTRMQCYAHASKDLPRYLEGIRLDPRAKDGDFLLAEQDGIPVGTSTHLSMHMWVRGSRVSCQGVAFVGTIKTARRGAKTGMSAGGGGVASQLMQETIRRARDRGDIVTALMPFRASFYERFGYGLVETRNGWSLPISVLPTGDFDGIRFAQPADHDAIVGLRQKTVERGQCDIERTSDAWKLTHAKAADGFEIVDRPAIDGPARGYLWYTHAHERGTDVLKVMDAFYEDEAALRRLLHYLASQRDQYGLVTILLPPDLPLNWLLKETQLPHRPVNHATAKLEPVTRMQVRILDHKRLLEAMRFPTNVQVGLSVRILETEGQESRLRLDIAAGRCEVGAAASNTPRLECPDRVWAAIVCGEVAATQAVRLGLATSDGDVSPLDAFAIGPRPFCGEAF